MNKEYLKKRFLHQRETSSKRFNRGSREDLNSGESFVDAAVLIPLIVRDHGIDVLLTQRAAHLKHHPGQVSFPGGRREVHDASLANTAIRETHEETGIAPEFIEVIGHLPRMYTISAYDVDPVVALVSDGFELAPDSDEVETVFYVPLEYFADARNRIDSTIRYRGTDVPMVEWHYQDQRIWGATAAMILFLVDMLWASEVSHNDNR